MKSSSLLIPFSFAIGFVPDREFFARKKPLTIRSWETNLVPDVNQFPLDEYPMKGKGVRIMRFGLAGTTYGCHVQEFPAGSRSTFTATGREPSFALLKGKASR